MTKSFALLGLFVTLAAGCDCAGAPLQDAGPGLDAPGADVPGLDAPLGSDAGACGIAGTVCGASAECCAGLSCTDVGGTMLCASVCGTDGAACVLGTDCCSGNCRGGLCAPGLCATLGESCGVSGDCCSFRCEGGSCIDDPLTTCDPLGEACTGDGECCSERCAAADGGECAGEGCRCASAAACRASSELCTDDAQCCIGVCSRPDGATVGTCALSGSCAVAGEPCGTEGFNGACCSTVCLDAAGTGTPVCQPLGGCRVQDEPCRSDGECCSGACEMAGAAADGRPIFRCANAGSCIPAGEVCGGAGATMNCCPNGGGGTGCEPTSTGVSRCLGGDGTCTLPGEACTSTEMCCTETYPDITCAPGRGGANVCCLPDGAECDLGDTCCGGVCVPDAGGVLRCGATCVEDAMPCTTASDCCGCACVPDGAGGSVCTSDPAVCAPCTGGALGDFCNTDADCCNTPVVQCNEETGTEFPTCVLAG
jgi:hypothetical protein